MAIYGYIRRDYPIDTTAQVKILMELDCDNYFFENDDLNSDVELTKLMDILEEDDTIYIHSLETLGKHLKKLANFLEDLQEKGVHLVSLSEEIDTRKDDHFFRNVIDLANMEHSLLGHKTKTRIQKAKEVGTICGRPRISQSLVDKIVHLRKNHDYSLKRIADECGVSVATVYNYTSKEENEREAL